MPNLIVSPNVDTLLSAADNAAIRTNIELGTTSSPTFANLTLTSPSLASDAPVTISQTWNAGSNVMTALKVVATDTASGGTSSLLDVQTTAGGSQFSVKKGVQIAGYTQANAYGIQSTYFRVGGFYNTGAICGNTGLYLFQSPTVESGISIGNIGVGRNAVQIRNAELTFGAANLVALAEEGAGQLALRNAGAPQTFNVYGTSGTNNTDYRRLSLSCPTTGEATIQSQFSTPLVVTGGSAPSTTATITFAAQAAAFPVGSTVVVSGVTPSGYNGTYTVTASTTTSVSYTVAAALANWSSGGTAVVSGFTGTVSINGVPVGLGKGNVSSNVAIGLTVLNSNTTGSNNIGIGAVALDLITTGSNNIAIGAGASSFTTTGINNVAIGHGALRYNHGGASQNVAIGASAGEFAISSTSVFIGTSAGPETNNQSNQIAIGYQAAGIGSNSVVLGNSSITKTALRGNVGIGTTNPTANLQIAQLTTGVGTISVGAGLTTVTGVGTQFLNTFKIGDTITSAGQTLTISAIASDTSMTTSAAGAAISGQPYTLVGGTRMSVLGNGNVGIGTTSPTSKLHVVGDAVLTGDLLGTNYTIGVPTILTQSNISITNNHSGVADSAIVITPKGTGGVIFGPKPDGTATGGNARGNYAVDLQAKRGINTQVASGINSFIAGGIDNTASGNYSFVAGNGNIASGNFSSINGGIGNTASSLNSLVCGGESNIASGGRSNISGGLSNSTTALLGFIAGGQNGLADRYSLNAHAAGQFSTRGDAQKTTAVFRNKTTTNSPVELFLDGSSTRYTVSSGKIISMLINITGTKSDGSAVAHYVRQYSIKNIGGTTSEVYAAVTVGTDNAAGTSIALSANDTNDALKIEVTGVAAETWRWVASVDAVEVGHGV